jgi:DNA modification methylase
MTSDDGALREFVARYARAYDAETDSYDRPPFAEDIKEGKNDPIYNAHSYHTKVPPRGIIPYILHYTEPGDLILDPFCGSGMTGVAALMCADPPADLLVQFPDLADRVGPRRAILNDLSPAACHIAYNYTTPVDVEALRREFERIKAAVKEEFAWLYGTEHYEPAVGAYDPRRPEVAERLKNPDEETAGAALFESEAERTWELVDRTEVERRLGYPVTDLPRGKEWGHLDVSTVEQWVVIPATIQYTIWSDVYRCEGFVTIEEPTGKTSTRGKNAGKPIVRKRRVARGCGGEIVLWDVLVDQDSGSVSLTLSCPSCSEPWSKKQLTLLRNVPIRSILLPERALREKGESTRAPRLSRLLTTREREALERIDADDIPSWYPSGQIDVGREMMRHGLLGRGIRNYRDFYSFRLLRALARVWAEISLCRDPRVQDALRFSFTSILHRSSRLHRLRPSGIGGGGALTGTLYVGSFWRENDPLGDFLETLPLLESLALLCRPGGVVTNCESATRIDAVGDSSVDYVFADPPFGSNIFYADCSMLWESWLGRFTDEEAEIVVSDRRVGGCRKDLSQYGALMGRAFAEMFRVLKPGRWATIEFNNKDGAVFEVIKDAIRSAGFEIANMLLFDKKQKTFKQVKGASGEEDVVDKDVIFNLRKPSHTAVAVTSAEHDLERHVIDVVREHLRTLPERMNAEPAKYSDDYRTTATLNSVLMNALLPKGVRIESLSLPFIEKACGRYFRKVGQRWYLRGEAVGGDAGVERHLQEEVSVSGEESAIRWLRQKLRTAPALIGELRPHWMRATGLLAREVSEGLDLEDLLSANFWRDEDSNRWREPSDVERERMNDDRALRVLHDAERFVDGSLKRHPSEAERAGWIDTLYRAAAEWGGKVATGPSFQRIEPGAAYTAIIRLFHGLLGERLDPDVLKRARKQTDAASAKLKKLAPEGPQSSPSAKNANFSLFDDPDGGSR